MDYENELDSFKNRYRLCSDYPYCQDEGCTRCLYSMESPSPKQLVFMSDGPHCTLCNEPFLFYGPCRFCYPKTKQDVT